MTLERLLTNIEYNDDNDRNISILSTQSTIPPEELSYIIDITDSETYFPKRKIYISDVKKSENINNNDLIIIKLLSTILIIILVVLFVLFQSYDAG